VSSIWATRGLASTLAGSAVWRLAEDADGIARLEETVSACRAALQEHTRERAPMRWALTQRDLGLALMTLGAHEGRTERLVLSSLAPGWSDLSGRAARTIWVSVEDGEDAVPGM
jgi:hypothetical protein